MVGPWNDLASQVHQTWYRLISLHVEFVKNTMYAQWPMDIDDLKNKIAIAFMQIMVFFIYPSPKRSPIIPPTSLSQ